MGAPAFIEKRFSAMVQQRLGKELHVSRCSPGYLAMSGAPEGAISGFGGTAFFAEVSVECLMLAEPEVTAVLLGPLAGRVLLGRLREFLLGMSCVFFTSDVSVAGIIFAAKRRAESEVQRQRS